MDVDVEMHPYAFGVVDVDVEVIDVDVVIVEASDICFSVDIPTERVVTFLVATCSDGVSGAHCFLVACRAMFFM